MKLNTTVLCGLAIAGFAGPSFADERAFGDGVLPEALQIYDLDGDGKLSAEEAQAMKEARRNRHEEHQSRWDTDGDGLLSEEERAAARATLRAQIEEKRAERFAEVDTDGDGSISPGEFAEIPALARLLAVHPERVDALFGHLDKNDDGFITADEFLARLGGRHDVPPPPRDGGGDTPPPPGEGGVAQPR